VPVALRQAARVQRANALRIAPLGLDFAPERRVLIAARQALPLTHVESRPDWGALRRLVQAQVSGSLRAL